MSEEHNSLYTTKTGALVEYNPEFEFIITKVGIMIEYYYPFIAFRTTKVGVVLEYAPITEGGDVYGPAVQMI